MNETVVVVTGASPLDPAVVDALPTHAIVLAADGGLDHALAAGLTPAGLVGDLDSVSADGLAWAEEHATIERHDPDKDRTDTELALKMAVALDPATPERAAIYRSAGREVVMLATGIAEGALASDVEVAFQSMEQGLPEAVAVMDLADPAFQNNRGLASAVVPILKAQGRGLLTWDAGLNAADQVARREDLEAAVVFRDLGAAGADRVALRRLLDRAVFKAGQDGQVAVVGEANSDTVAALLEWSVEGKAATVALAPLTAVLKID